MNKQNLYNITLRLSVRPSVRPSVLTTFSQKVLIRWGCPLAPTFVMTMRSDLKKNGVRVMNN